MHIEVSGHYKLEVRKSNGEIRQTLEFDNLITDIGLDRMGDYADWFAYCQVGSGSTTPSVGDTALVAWIAGSGTLFGAAAQAAQPSAPYYCSTTKTIRFSAGVATGNISEVGMGWAVSGAALYSRALVLDGVGAPTTITLLADETLDVTYQIRQYMPTVDATGTITLRGTVHDYIGRASSVTSGSYVFGWSMGSQGISAGYQRTSNYYLAYDGAIGAITGTPAGASSASSSVSTIAYSAGSYEREHTMNWGLTAGNFGTGITAINGKMGIGPYQFGFDPAIMKTDVDELSLTFKISWARKTL